MTQASPRRILFRDRLFPVLALEAEAPLSGWLGGLDFCLERSPGFFAGKWIVVDVSRLGLDRSGLVDLVPKLKERGVRIMALTGVDPSWTSDELPPILTGGRAIGLSNDPKGVNGGSASPNGELGQLTPNEQAAFHEIASALNADADQPSDHDPLRERASEPAVVAPLIVNEPVRSGQTVFYPEGDVTIIGSVSSGADVIAGGSIHVYGALRGRAIAGAYGETRARIFCRRLEAELLAVGGVYVTADEIETNVYRQPAQAWLEDESVRIAQLD